MKTNVTVLIVTTLIVAAGAYWYFFANAGNAPPLTTDTTDNQSQLQFQILVGQLQPISFNTKIFDNASFLALIDLTTPISPETTGRTDPFAAISGIK